MVSFRVETVSGKPITTEVSHFHAMYFVKIVFPLVQAPGPVRGWRTRVERGGTNLVQAWHGGNKRRHYGLFHPTARLPCSLSNLPGFASALSQR